VTPLWVPGAGARLTAAPVLFAEGCCVPALTRFTKIPLRRTQPPRPAPSDGYPTDVVRWKRYPVQPACETACSDASAEQRVFVGFAVLEECESGRTGTLGKRV
jgi:hypothetical protein